MPDTKYFLDVAGLSRFKKKQDQYNKDTYLGLHAKADTAGAADTATKLAASVTINDVAFDGSANITIEDKTKLSLKEAEKYLTITDASDTYVTKTGNAASATKLATAVTINGVQFDGSESITLPSDDTKLDVNATAKKALEADHATNADEATHATKADAATTADTASKVANALTINNTAFDGSTAVSLTLIDASEKGAANGVATLGADGLIPSAQLPSYVDDVKEYESLTAFPADGEKDKIYVATDTGSIYRWSGTQYIQINSSVLSADTATKLTTARNIAGVAFDGTADISIPAANVGAYTTTEVDSKISAVETNVANTYVAKVTGKDLSDNNFTAELLAKLNGIEEGANKYVLPTAAKNTIGGVSIGANITIDTGMISVTSANVIAALGYTPSDAAAEVPVEAIADSEIDALFGTANA